MNIYTLHNIIHHDPEVTEDQVLIHLGTPSYTVTPYDTYARYIAKDASKAFMRAGIPAEIHLCHRRIASVGWGSGQGGCVRFGDDMLPPDVQAVVAKVDEERAKTAWEDWQARRHFRRPVSVSGALWYESKGDQGIWHRGGTWPYVVRNAIALAKFLGKPWDKLEQYASKITNKNHDHSTIPTDPA